MSGWSGRKVTTARAYWRARLPLPCYRCRLPVLASQAWHVEHVVDRALGGAHGVENQWVSHQHCNTSAGGKRGAAITNARREPEKSARIETRPLKW